MNSFIRELNETNEFIIITQIIHSSNRSRLSRMRFAESSGRAQPAKTTGSHTVKAFFFMSRLGRLDHHESAARACLRALMIALI